MICKAALLFSISLVPTVAWAQHEGVLHRVEANTFRPEQQPFTDDMLGRLKVPEGFEVSVFARDLGNPRMMAVSENGTLYVTRPEQKDVIALTEESGEPKVIASDLQGFMASPSETDESSSPPSVKCSRRI